MRHLNRTVPVILFLFILISAGCAGSAGTTGGGQAVSTVEAAEPVGDFGGLWQGMMSLSEGDGEVTMRFNWEEDSYSLQTSVNYQGQSETASVSRVSFEGNRCSFWMGFDVFGVDVFCKSRLEDGKLVGTVEVYQEGTLVDEGIFTLHKR